MATARMLRTQALFYVIAISLQIASGQRDRYNYREEDNLNDDYYNMIIPDLEEALQNLESFMATAEANNNEAAYENALDVLHSLVEYTRNSNNAYKFIKLKGIDRIIPMNLKSNNIKVRTRTLIFMKSLFDIAPTTMSASMPIVIVDKILDIFETDKMPLKSHAVDVLTYWLPGNPRVQARVMKLKGLVPFYDQVDKLDTHVIVSLVNLFTKVLQEHIRVRSDSQKHLVDNDQMKFYLRTGLLEYMSTETVCNGLLDILTKLWSSSSEEHGVLVVAFDLIKTIQPYCLTMYQTNERAKKLFADLSTFVNDADNQEFFDVYNLNVTDVALVVAGYMEKFNVPNIKDEITFQGLPASHGAQYLRSPIISDRIRNSTLRSKTQIADVGQKAASLKWNWAGHVCHMSDARWAKLTTEWSPLNVNRRRGRPRRRWLVELDAYEKDWPQKALHMEGG
uniref:SFRICE_003839 n=1 Tax=Spodoptera frugiperda TaxID=7108 RepID=A0A2H1W799_SPOFR